MNVRDICCIRGKNREIYIFFQNLAHKIPISRSIILFIDSIHLFALIPACIAILSFISNNLRYF